MKCKITRNAAKKLKEILAQEEAQGKMVRVLISHKHGNHAHYGLDLDVPGEEDVIVHTDKEIDVLLNKNEDLLDGVKINFLYLPKEQFEITNPSKGNHGDH